MVVHSGDRHRSTYIHGQWVKLCKTLGEGSTAKFQAGCLCFVGTQQLLFKLEILRESVIYLGEFSI